MKELIFLDKYKNLEPREEFPEGPFGSSIHEKEPVHSENKRGKTRHNETTEYDEKKRKAYKK